MGHPIRKLTSPPRRSHAGEVGCLIAIAGQSCSSQQCVTTGKTQVPRNGTIFNCGPAPQNRTRETGSLVHRIRCKRDRIFNWTGRAKSQGQILPSLRMLALLPPRPWVGPTRCPSSCHAAWATIANLHSSIPFNLPE